MQPLTAFNATAEYTRSSIDRAIAASPEACDCLVLEHSLGLMLSLLKDVWAFDRCMMLEIYNGECSLDVLEQPPFQKLVRRLEEDVPAAIRAGESFEGRGYNVKHLDDLRAFRIDDLGFLAIIRQARGEDPAAPRNIVDAIAQIEAQPA